jgi:glycosyltransferase involved in cell wall biosynthesis
MPDMPLISVIITTKNEEKNIGTVLSSIKNQTYLNIEIIVVDNFSEDKTAKIALTYTPRVVNKGPERSTQRNYGVEIANGDFVLILDADMKLESTVIEDCYKEALKGADAVIIPEESYGTTFWAKCKWVEKRCYQGDDTIEAARFFDRDVYLSIGGFNPDLISGEDWDLMNRIRKAGYKVSRIKSLIYHNEGNLKLFKTLKKKYYYGQKINAYKKQNIEEFKTQAKFFRPAFKRNWKFLAKNSIFTAGMFFMKACEFTAAGCGYLKSRLKKNCKGCLD